MLVGMVIGHILIRDATGGKTAKTEVLPAFCNIERGTGSGGGAPICGHHYDGLASQKYVVANLLMVMFI
jgi:hypothetical protein